VNNSFSSLNQGSAPTPEPKALRERADSNVQVRSFLQARCCAVRTTMCDVD
jgi:hypothetical protein